MDKKRLKWDLTRKDRTMRNDRLRKQYERDKKQRSEERLERRVSSADDLVNRNRVIVSRVNEIISLTPVDGVTTTGIILGPTPVTQMTPNHLTICLLSGRNYSKLPPANEWAEFEFFHVRAGSKLLKGIKKQNTCRTHALSAPPEPNAFIVKGPKERTFDVSHNLRNDSIYSEVWDLSSGRVLEPIKALQRASRLIVVSSEISGLEDTLKMVELAIEDSGLNPFLNSRIRETKLQQIA